MPTFPFPPSPISWGPPSLRGLSRLRRARILPIIWAQAKVTSVAGPTPFPPTHKRLLRWREGTPSIKDSSRWGPLYLLPLNTSSCLSPPAAGRYTLLVWPPDARKISAAGGYHGGGGIPLKPTLSQRKPSIRQYGFSGYPRRPNSWPDYIVITGTSL